MDSDGARDDSDEDIDAGLRPSPASTEADRPWVAPPGERSHTLRPAQSRQSPATRAHSHARHTKSACLARTDQESIDALVRERALALLSGFFSIVAIVLVTVGLYGILSCSVVARTRRIGIRLAPGARPLRVIGLVLTEVGVITTIGLAVGIAGGFAGSRFITALLYQVQPTDVRSVALPLMSVLVAAAFSALIPALRATHVDPMTALRND